MLEFGRLVQVVVALRLLDPAVDLFDPAPQVPDAGYHVLFGLVLRPERVGLLPGLLKLPAEDLEPLPARRVLFLRQRGLLDLQLHDATRCVVQFRRQRVDFRPDHRARLVDEVDRLVRQEAVRDVAVREHGRSDERIVADPHAVMYLEAFLESAQNGNRILDVRLLHENRLETPRQRGVLFDMLAEFVRRRGADAVQLAAREHGLQHVARVDGAFRGSRPHDRVQLVDEKDDPPFALTDFGQHRLQSFLEFAAVLGSREERTHIQREDRPVLQAFRHVPAHDPFREPLDDGRLSDAGVPDQDGIVLRLPAQDADHPADLLVASYDRVELSLPRHLHEVATVLLQRFVRLLGRIARHALRAPDLRQRRKKAVLRHAVRAEDLSGRRTRARTLRQDRRHDVLHGDVFVLEAGRHLPRVHENLVQPLRNIDFSRFSAGAGNPRQSREFALDVLRKAIRIDFHPPQDPRNEAVLLAQHGQKKVLRLDARIPRRNGERLRLGERFLRFFRKRGQIHVHPPI